MIRIRWVRPDRRSTSVVEAIDGVQLGDLVRRLMTFDERARVEWADVIVEVRRSNRVLRPSQRSKVLVDGDQIVVRMRPEGRKKEHRHERKYNESDVSERGRRRVRRHTERG